MITANHQAKMMAVFQKSTDTSEAIDALHGSGIEHDQIVVMTGVPFPEGALGRHSEWSRLPYIVLAGALAGMLFGLFFSVVTPNFYPLSVGGHPTVGFAPAAVITFVFTMMATIISTFLGVIWEMNFPEFGPKEYNPLVTDGYLALIVEYPKEQESKIREILSTHGADQVQTPEIQSL